MVVAVTVKDKCDPGGPADLTAHLSLVYVTPLCAVEDLVSRQSLCLKKGGEFPPSG